MHNEETSLIICKFKHAQIPVICNKFRAKLTTVAKMPCRPRLLREGKQIKNSKMQYSKSGFNAMI